VHRQAAAPGRGPRIRDRTVMRGGKERRSAPCVCAVSGARRNHEPAPRDGERSAATATRCETPGEPAARRRAMPIHPLREALRPRRAGTSPRSRVRRPATRRQAIARTDGERALEGHKPRKASTAGSPRGPGGSTDSPRVKGPGGGRVVVAPRERRPPATSGGLGPREGNPPRRGERLEGQSPGTLRCGRAGRVGGVGREGGDQTPDVARGRRRDPPSLMRVHRPGMCRRAAKPRRGSTVRRSDAGCRWRHDGTVWGSDEPTSGGAGKRKGGRPVTSVAGQVPPVGPDGRRNAARVGRNR
jgi:hypothetical protein